MKKLFLLTSLALLGATISTCEPTIAAKNANKSNNEPFVGRYQCWGTLSDRTKSAHGVVEIVHENNSFRLTGLKAYEKQKFVKRSASTLDGGSIGDLELGQMKFGGTSPETRKVVRARFCYDHFYLLKIE